MMHVIKKPHSGTALMAAAFLACSHKVPGSPEVAESHPTRSAVGPDKANPPPQGGTANAPMNTWEEACAGGGAGTGARDSESQRDHRVDRHGTVVTESCLEALRVVDYLADQSSYPNAFNPRLSKRIDPKRVLPLLSASGLRLMDVNDHRDTQVPLQEVEKQILARKGPAFRMLVHLGHIYAQPLQYSRVTCSEREDGLVVELTHWYRLTYRAAGTGHALAQIEYLELEGD